VRSAINPDPNLALDLLSQSRHLTNREQLQGQFAAASMGFESRSRTELAKLFGGDRLNPAAKIFHSGQARNNDNVILSQVFDCLLSSPDRPVRILEVAAGTTYGKYLEFGDACLHYGSAWHSRRIKSALGDRVEMSVSDQTPDSTNT